MRPFWKRSSPESLAAKGDIDGLRDALLLQDRDFVEGPSGDYFDLSWERRAAAARHLAVVSADGVIASLLEALGDPAPQVRLDALRSLVGRDDPIDEGVMAWVLRWPEDDARVHAESLLSDRAARDPGAAGRMAAAYLAANGDSEQQLSNRWAEQVLVGASPSERRRVVDEAVRTLVEAEDDAPRSRQLIAADPMGATPMLLAALDDDRARLPSVRMLGQLQDSAATVPLTRLLQHSDVDARREAAAALGTIQDPRAIDALLLSTADAEYEVRDAALRALDSFGNAGIVWGLASAARGVLAEMIERGDEWAAAVQASRSAQTPAFEQAVARELPAPDLGTALRGVDDQTDGQATREDREIAAESGASAHEATREPPVAAEASGGGAPTPPDPLTRPGVRRWRELRR